MGNKMRLALGSYSELTVTGSDDTRTRGEGEREKMREGRRETDRVKIGRAHV